MASCSVQFKILVVLTFFVYKYLKIKNFEIVGLITFDSEFHLFYSTLFLPRLPRGRKSHYVLDIWPNVNSRKVIDRSVV